MVDAVRPSILSLRFHTRFFPALVRSRLKGEGARSGFTSVLELQAGTALGVILVMVGTTLLGAHRAVLGGLVAGVGGLLLLALAIHSVASAWGRRPTFDEFLVAPFFLFLAAGPSAGLLVGTLGHSLPWGIAAALAGLAAGYALGILAGWGLPWLGWMAGAVCGLCWFALLGLLFTDMIFLSIALFT